MKTEMKILPNPSMSEQIEIRKEKHENYNPEFVGKVLKGDDDFENGNFQIIKTDVLFESSL